MYIDEAVFSRNTTLDIAYSKKYDPIYTKQMLYERKPVYLISAISAEFGLEAYSIHDKSPNTIKYCAILDVVNENGMNYAILGDNVSYHTSKMAENYYQQNNLIFLPSVQGCPELNPVECYFLRVKTVYKRLRNDEIVKGRFENVVELVMQAVESLAN